MQKPNREEYGWKDGKFPTETDLKRYNKERGIYLAHKRKENKQKLLDEVVEMIDEDHYNYRRVIKDCLYESFSKCTQKELKTWL